MKIESTASFRRCLRGLSDERLESILNALCAAAEAYGRPHLHAGSACESSVTSSSAATRLTKG